MANKSKKIIIPVDIVTKLKSQGTDLNNYINKFKDLSSTERFSKEQKAFVAGLEGIFSKIAVLNEKSWDPKNLEKYKKYVEDITAEISRMSELSQSISQNMQSADIKKLADIQNRIFSKQNIVNEKKSDLAKMAGIDPKDLDQVNILLQNGASAKAIASKKGFNGIQNSNLIQQEKEYMNLRKSVKAYLKEIEELRVKETQQVEALQKVEQSTHIYTNTLKTATSAAEDAQNAVNAGISQNNILKADEIEAKMKGVITQFTGFRIALDLAKKSVREAVQTYKDLDDSYSNIAAVSGKTREEMWAMNEQFNELAQRLGTTTQQVVEASKLYYQQGRSQAEVMELVEQTTILATVSELNFAKATDFMTAAINGFGIKASEAVTITDAWSALAAQSAVDVNELATAISKVASLAGSVGMSMESTSAFLSKMIETTREAPENLGTGLKTVIARFSEIKKDTEQLSDGTPINRVEEALKIANVELRDSAGQIRKFDDIILDLSKAWDSLTVNQQRYIATQAAGSRQQSRFIALVEDYDRNLELLSIAQDSAGASSQQFNTQITGLQASMNRLKSAWEGLYTSLESGPSLLSNSIDLAAKLVSTLADFGAGNTAAALIIEAVAGKIALENAALAVHTALTLKDTAAIEKNNRVQELDGQYFEKGGSIFRFEAKEGILSHAEVTDENAKKVREQGLALTEEEASEALEKLYNLNKKNIAETLKSKGAFEAFKVSAKNAKTSLAQLAGTFSTSLIAVAPYALAILGVTAAIGGIILVATKAERDLKKLNKTFTESQNLSVQHNSEAKAIDTLISKYEDLYKSGKDLTEIKQQIIDQYKDEIPNIELLVGDYVQLKQAMDDLKSEKIIESGKESIKALNTNKEIENNFLSKTYTYNKGSQTHRVKIEKDENGYWVKDIASRKYINEEALKSAEDLRNFLSSEGVEGLENYTQAVWGLADASRVAAGMSESLGEKISGAFLNSYLIQNPDIELDEETGDFVNQDQRTKFLEANRQLQSLLAQVDDETRGQIERYVNGQYSDLTIAEINNIQNMFAEVADKIGDKDVKKIFAQVINQFESDYNSSRENLDKQLTDIGLGKVASQISPMLGQTLLEAAKDGFPTHLIEKFYTEAYSEELTEALKKIKIDGANLSDMLQNLDITDSQAVLDFLSKVKEEAPEAASELEKVIGLLQSSFDSKKVDIAGEISSINQEFSQGLESLKNATEKTVDDITKETLKLQFNLSEDDFKFDNALNGYILNKEAAIRVGEEQLALSKEESVARIKAYGELIGLNDITNDLTVNNIAETKAKILNAMATEELVLHSGMLAGVTQEETENIKNQLPQLKLLTGHSLLAAEAIKSTAAAANIQKRAFEIWSEGNIGYNEAFDQAAQELFIALTPLEETLQPIIDSLNTADKLFGDTGRVQDYFADKTGKATDAIKEQTKALQDQIETLKKSRDELKNSINNTYDLLQERLNKELDSNKAAVENYYEALDKAFKELIDKSKEALDDLKDKADDLKEIAGDNGKDLKDQSDAVIKFYDSEIEAIQSKIDLLNKEKDSLEDVKKLQEARDKYEQAKQKTRLVLTHGGGWRFKSDIAAIQEAEEDLAAIEQERQVDLLQQQIDNLEKIKSQWQEIAENIGKATSELEKEANFQAYLNGLNDKQLEKLKEQFKQSVGVNNILSEQAKQAQDKYETENNAKAEGTLAWQIEQWEKAQEQASKDKEKFDIATDPSKQGILDLQNKFQDEIAAGGQQAIDKILADGLALSEKNAETINAINSTLTRLEEVMKTIDMTSSEIRDYNAALDEINSASLESLLENGTTYNQLLSQIDESIKLNDQIEALEKEIDAIEAGEKSNAGQTAQTAKTISKQIGGNEGSSLHQSTVNIDNTLEHYLGQIEASVEALQYDLDDIKNSKLNCTLESIRREIANIDFSCGCGGTNAAGGVVYDSKMHKMDGTTLHPEMVLNANQSAKLFNWIDGLPNRMNVDTYFPSFANQSKSSLPISNLTEGTSFSNCSFNIESNSNSLDGLIADIKRNIPFR